MASERVSRQAFFGVSALLFALAAIEMQQPALARLAPAGEPQAIGAVAVGAGLFLVARAAGLG